MSQDERDSSDDVGTVGEEAAKLLGALSGWARDHVGAAGDGHIDTGAPECTYCPICKTVHVLRQANPEVRTQLATAASALLQAVAGLMATPVPAERTTGVQHIDLDDDHDDDSADWPEDTDPGEGDR